MIINQLAAFLPAAILFACTPGANNLLSFQNGASHGVLIAFQAVAGRCVAYVIMVTLVVAGLGKILETSELVFQTIKWLGVIYLAWLGISMIRTSGQRKNNPEEIVSQASGRGVWTHVRREFIVAMANPKAILLFGALLPQFIDSSSELSYGTQMMLLGLIYSVMEWCTATLYAFMGKAATSGSGGIKRMIALQRFSGVILLGISGMLAFSKRSQN